MAIKLHHKCFILWLHGWCILHGWGKSKSRKFEKYRKNVS